jgi:hypothetical protein
MDNSDLGRRVLELVNLARATYGAFALETLLRGQPRSASFCPIGRSLHIGVEYWLFVAVGTKYLRVWALGKEPAAIAERILLAWRMPHGGLKQSGGRSGCVTSALPPEMCEFVDQFDRGFLPDYQGQVDCQEMRQLRELARDIPILGEAKYEPRRPSNLNESVYQGLKPLAGRSRAAGGFDSPGSPVSPTQA